MGPANTFYENKHVLTNIRVKLGNTCSPLSKARRSREQMLPLFARAQRSARCTAGVGAGSGLQVAETRCAARALKLDEGRGPGSSLLRRSRSVTSRDARAAIMLLEMHNAARQRQFSQNDYGQIKIYIYIYIYMCSQLGPLHTEFAVRVNTSTY